MSGNLCYQIEHHLFPDLPSNRYAEISIRVRELCDKYDLPYTTGSFLVQYGKTWRTIAKLSLPDKFLRDTPTTRRRPVASGCSTAGAGAGLRDHRSRHRTQERAADGDRQGARDAKAAQRQAQ